MHRVHGPVDTTDPWLEMTGTVVVGHVTRLAVGGGARPHPPGAACTHPQITEAFGRLGDGCRLDLDDGHAIDTLRIQDPKVHAGEQKGETRVGDIQPPRAVSRNRLKQDVVQVVGLDPFAVVAVVLHGGDAPLRVVTHRGAQDFVCHDRK